MRRSLASLLTAGVLAFGASGCGGGDEETVVIVPVLTGTLTVEWTIDGVPDPGLCQVAGADAFELLIYDEFGDFVAEVEAPCEDFIVSVDIDEGFYSADATLVDFADQAVTTTGTLDAIDVFGDSELVIDIDFPTSSFL